MNQITIKPDKEGVNITTDKEGNIIIKGNFKVITCKGK